MEGRKRVEKKMKRIEIKTTSQYRKLLTLTVGQETELQAHFYTRYEAVKWGSRTVKWCFRLFPC